MIWYILYQIVVGLLALWMLKITYFFIKRRYTPSSIVDQNSTEESDICTTSENVYNESSSESLNLEHEKELLGRLDQKDESSEKTMDTNNVTECSGYGSTVDEMLENNSYTTSQDVFESCKHNSDSHSSIISWESCNKEISQSESDFVNSLPSENHTRISQPLNLCIRDKKNETETNKTKRAFFTDRKYKSTKGIQKIDSGKYLLTEIIEDQRSLNFEKLKNLDCSKNIEYSLNNDRMEYNLDYTEQELMLENNMEISELSSIHHDEYSLDSTENELKFEKNMEISELSSIHHDKYSLDNTEHELKLENNLEITELSSIHHDEYSLDSTENELKFENNLEITEQELKNKNNLEITELSFIHHDKYSLDNTEHELKLENNLEITKLSSIHDDELKNEYSFDNTKHSLNDDEVMLGNDLETTRLSPIHQDEQHYEYNLESLELSFLDNDKSISGIDSPIMKFNHDYENQDSKRFNNTSSSECTESFPSPIFNNDSSNDDIRYVEDYNDISFFNALLSDDALNEAFVED